ncbi:MAG: hypothetical protein R3F11_11060 [Verrucomicrobiales bacterium]
MPESRAEPRRSSAAASVKLGSLALKSGNDYAAVIAVALDGAPLESSKRILVQIGTVARPHGWKTRATPKGEEITDLGSAPWNVADTDLELSLANPALQVAHPARRQRDAPPTSMWPGKAGRSASRCPPTPCM